MSKITRSDFEIESSDSLHFPICLRWANGCLGFCAGVIPQTVLALGVLTVLLRALERYLDPVALPGSIFPCNLQYLVTPTLKNTQ